jgi:hypothetical protein
MATLSLFAIPAFQSRRILENEGSARRTLRDIVAAQRTFAAGHSGTTYGFLWNFSAKGLCDAEFRFDRRRSWRPA